MYNPCIIVGIFRSIFYSVQIELVLKQTNSNKCSCIVRSLSTCPSEETLAETPSSLKLRH